MSRRDFLKLGGAALASLAFTRLPKSWQGTDNPLKNEEILAFGNPEFLPSKTIEIEGKFAPNKPVTIYDFPLKTDLTFDPKQKITVFEMPSQTNLSYHNFYFCRDYSQPTDQQIRRMTILPNTMGSNNLAIAELDHGKFDSLGDYLPVGTEHPGLRHPLNKILGDTTYITGDGGIYPDKILNLLNATANILEGQEQSGPLLKDQIYSYLELIHLPNGADYVPDFPGIIMRGGGVCAGATAISNSLWAAAKNLGIDYKKTFQAPKFSHPQRYKLGPLGPDTFITDTTVQINSDGTKYDYHFIPPADLYIDVHVAAIPNGVAFSETDSRGLYIVNGNDTIQRSDAQFLLNISLTTEPPKTKARDLRAIRQQFIDFRSTNHRGSTNMMANGCRFIGSSDWDKTKGSDLGPQIYPEQDTSLFSSEIAHSGYLQDVFTLEKILNSSETGTKSMAALVRNSEWYKSKVKAGQVNQTMEGAISQLDYVHIPGQPVQCVAWAALIANLPYPNMPVNIGSVPINGPADLIPNSILTYPDRQTAYSEAGGKLIAERDMKISDINSNDLFLMRSSIVGHVGVILSRKSYGGKPYLLVTESNRHNDGRIQTYTVDEYNFNAKLGIPPEKKILLRK